MREFLLPAIIFFSSSLWGFYDRIPFTTVEPNRPFMDRAVGCVQLATAAYAIEQAYQNISTGLTEPDNSAATETTTAQAFILPDLETNWNITVQSPASAVATRTQIDHVSFVFPSNWSAEATLAMSEPTPRPDVLFANMAMIVMVILLALALKQAFNREVTDLAQKLNTFIICPPAWVSELVNNAIPKSISNLFDGHLQAIWVHLLRIETAGIQLANQVFGNGQELHRLRDEVLTARREICAAQTSVQNTIQTTIQTVVQDSIQIVVSNAVRSSIQSAVQTPIQNAIQATLPPAVHTTIQNTIQASIRHAVETSIQTAVQASIQNAVQTSLESALQALVQDTVQNAIHSAIQATAATSSENANRANDAIIIQMLNDQNDIRKETEVKLGQLSNAIGKCEYALRSIKGLTRLSEDLSRNITDDFASQLAWTGRSGTADTRRTSSTGNGGSQDKRIQEQAQENEGVDNQVEGPERAT